MFPGGDLWPGIKELSVFELCGKISAMASFPSGAHYLIMSTGAWAPNCLALLLLLIRQSWFCLISAAGICFFFFGGSRMKRLIKPGHQQKGYFWGLQTVVWMVKQPNSCRWRLSSNCCAKKKRKGWKHLWQWWLRKNCAQYQVLSGKNWEFTFSCTKLHKRFFLHSISMPPTSQHLLTWTSLRLGLWPNFLLKPKFFILLLTEILEYLLWMSDE